jgi:hypothetical protein
MVASHGVVSLENRKSKITLTDANAIVQYVWALFQINLRYLYELSTKKSVSWSDLSFIEWENNALGAQPTAEQLKEAESKLPQVENELKSPASIILFASLYNLSSQLSAYPVLSKFIFSIIETDFGKTGIELATGHTTTEKVDASSVATGTVVNADIVPGSQHLRSGIILKKPTGKIMCEPLIYVLMKYAYSWSEKHPHHLGFTIRE